MLPHAFLGRSIFRLFRSPAGLPTKVDAQIQLSTDREAFASGRVPHYQNLAAPDELSCVGDPRIARTVWWS
jgi:hypothetical protein